MSVKTENMSSQEYRDWINGQVKINQEMLQLSQAECRGLGLTDDEIIDLTEKAMIAYSKKEVEMPAKIGIHPLKDTLMHAMPAYIAKDFACGIKWASCFPENRARFGYSQTTGILVFNDHESGSPVCLMDAVYITEVRTAAVAVAAVKKLGNLKAKRFGMVGCGVQGNAQVGMIEKALKELEEIYVIDAYAPAMNELIQRQQPKVKAKIIKASSYEEMALKCDVMCSAAIIKEKPDPKFKDEWFRPGQTLVMSDCHTFYEDATMKRADKYLLDSVEQHELLVHYGYYPQGLPKIYGETGEVLGGLKPGRESEEEFIVCNNVGMAVEDIMVARRIFDLALEKGAGRKVPL